MVVTTNLINPHPTEKTDDMAMPQVNASDKEVMAVDVCGDGGLMKTILKEGTGDEKPQSGDTVMVHYVGTLLDGSEFDSSRARNQPFSFKLGQGQVIKGWDKGLATMRKGEHAILQCRADYAYGKAGSPPKIPADATLNFDVELLSWTSGEDISKDGGVIGKRVAEGEGWRNPKDGEECLVSYKGTAAEGSVFVDEKEVWVTVGEGKVPKGVDKALTTMKKGSVWKLKCEPQYAYGAAGLPPHVAPNTAVDFEVSLHKWKEVSKIAGGAIKKIKLVEGEGYMSPNKFATVTVALGSEAPKDVGLGRGLLPDGVEQAILQMHKGEQSEIVVEPSHQDADFEPVSDAPKRYVVTLKDFKKAKEAYEMTTDEKLSTSEAYKESGTTLFKAAKYNLALKHYEQADKLLDSETGFTTDEEKSKKAALVLAARLNMAACELRLKKYKECVDVCSKVLKTDPDNVKALYRQGCAYNATNDLEEAKKVLQHAVKVDPTNTAAKKELSDVVKKLKAIGDREKKMFANMFA